MNNISVVIVTFNNEKTIKTCLDSVTKYSPDSEIILVDNGSGDDTLKILRQFDERAKIIKAEENLGFSKANNLGVKESSGKYLVFLNPDAMLTQPYALDRLVEILEENNNLGIAGPRFVFPDGSIQPKVRNLPTVFQAFKEYILCIKGAYNFYEPKCVDVCEVESVNGACMVIDKDLFLKAGGFDEKYFMYFEDLALCRSVRELGYKVVFDHQVVIKHAEGVSGLGQRTKDYLQDSSKKYHGILAYYLIELIFIPRRLLKKVQNLTSDYAHI